MRVLFMIVALLGAVAAAGMAVISFGSSPVEADREKQNLLNSFLPEARRAEALARLPVLVTLPYFLTAGCVLGMLGLVLASSNRTKCAAVLFLLAALGPAVLVAPLLSRQIDFLKDVAPSALLLLAGLLALLLRPKPALAGGGDEDVDN